MTIHVHVDSKQIYIYIYETIVPVYDNMKVKLGTIFTNTGNFNLTKKHLADKALKAMYEVWKIGRMYKLSIKCLHDLFDKMIKPILLYGREVWGFSNNDILEKIHLKFCKILLNLKTSTPSYMVYTVW